MRRMMGSLLMLFRRWKFVEEDLTIPSVAEARSDDSEPLRTRRQIERSERLLADYRRNGCVDLARDCEKSLRSLRTHLAALEF